MCPVLNFFKFQLNTFLFLSFHLPVGCAQLNSNAHSRIKRNPIIKF